MSDIAVSIAVNLLLGALLFALLYPKRTAQRARLRGPEDALTLFRRHFPDALGTATVASDGRGALIDLEREPYVGLLTAHGHRWNARLLAPGELRSVRLEQAEILDLKFADFAWPRARIRIADAGSRAAWLTRLAALAAARSDLGHA